MATSAARGARPGRLAQWRDGLKKGARRSTTLVGGVALVAAALLAALALVSYRPTDPAFNTSAAGPVNNWIGQTGAYAADLLLSLWGPPAGLLLPLVLVLGLRLLRGADAGRWLRALLLSIAGIRLVR